MRKVIFVVTLAIGVVSGGPVWAGLFSSCDAGSGTPRPDWVSHADYSLPGLYVGVGFAESEGRTREEQARVSEDNAKAQLVQQIEVTIHAETEQKTRVTGNRVENDDQSKVKVSAEEVLRDWQIKGRWVDSDTCVQYTLLTISKDTVARVKRETRMKRRFAQIRNNLEEGSDKVKNPDIEVRRKYLDAAQSLLMETDFSLLPEELGKEVYAKRLIDELSKLDSAASRTKGRMALFAIDQDGSMQSDVISTLLDQMREADRSVDRLMVDCSAENDCMNSAKERGFSRLALLKASRQVTTSQMGAIKGTLIVSRTEYDIESRRILKGPDTVSAQVIGWNDDELDWEYAAKKAVQDLK